MAGSGSAHVAEELQALAKKFPASHASTRETLHQKVLADVLSIPAWEAVLACEVGFNGNNSILTRSSHLCVSVFMTVDVSAFESHLLSKRRVKSLLASHRLRVARPAVI